MIDDFLGHDTASTLREQVVALWESNGDATTPATKADDNGSTTVFGSGRVGGGQVGFGHVAAPKTKTRYRIC